MVSDQLPWGYCSTAISEPAHEAIRLEIASRRVTMLRMLIPAIAVALLAIAPVSAQAAPCKDAKGKFVKCPPAPVKKQVCKKAGKFAKCGTPGAKPV